MAEESKISWTDATFNPWIGCTKVSAGCANCYAERDWDKRRHVAQWGPVGTRIVTSEANWKKPIRWNKQAEESGTRIKVFCASLADVFEDWPGQVRHYQGPKMWLMTQANGHNYSWGAGHVLDDPQSGRALKLSDIRHRLFTLIDQTPHLDWQLVTKRPENIRTMWPTPNTSPCKLGDGSVSHDFIGDRCRRCDGGRRNNVWLLTSVENQEQADKRIPELLKCRDLSPVLGLSCEPLLGPLDLTEDENYLNPECWGDCACDSVAGYDPGCRRNGGDGTLTRKLDWVITGGESGPRARPMHPNWVRSIRDQCEAAGVPFHFKQWGEWSPFTAMIEETHLAAAKKYQEITWSSANQTWRTPGRLGETAMYRCGKTLSGRLLDCREWNEFPRIHTSTTGERS